MKKLTIVILVLLTLILVSCNPYDRLKKSSANDIVDINNVCVGSLVHGIDEFKNLDRNGVQLARPNPGPFVWQWLERREGVYEWDISDEWVREAQRNEIALVGTIFPYNKWDQLSCHEQFDCSVGASDILLKGSSSQGNTLPEYRCGPCSNFQYKDFVKEMVERYDGDGINDMEGLEIPIMHWEIGNEPEIGDRKLTFFKGDTTQYVKMLEWGYRGVKEACEDCYVLHAGATSSQDSLDYWEAVIFEGGAQYFDIANIHYVDEWDKSTLNVADFRAMLEQNNVNKEIWVTKAEIFPNDNPQQLINGAFIAGASKVFFTDPNTASAVNLNSCLT